MVRILWALASKFASCHTPNMGCKVPLSFNQNISLASEKSLLIEKVLSSMHNNFFLKKDKRNNSYLRCRLQSCTCLKFVFPLKMFPIFSSKDGENESMMVPGSQESQTGSRMGPGQVIKPQNKQKFWRLEYFFNFSTEMCCEY